MKIVQGTVNGTGAALYVGIGFVPDFVLWKNLEDADCAVLTWGHQFLRFAEHCLGTHYYTAAGIVGDPMTVGDTGVVPYCGGETFAAAQTAYVGPIKNSEKNQKYNSSTGLVITKYTIDTAGSFTGHFDQEANSTYVGEGSWVKVNGKWYGCHTMTSNGEQDNETYLFGGDKGVYCPTGNVEFITPMYDFVGVAAGEITKAGFGITTTSVSNVSGEACWFVAMCFE